MKRMFFFILLSFLSANILLAQPVAYLKSSSFNAGEFLKYKLKYGFITAAEASLKVQKSDIKFNNTPVHHLVVEGRTTNAFDVFFKVRNRYESYIDQNTFSPFLYAERIRENSYKREDKARFYQSEKKVVATKGTYNAPTNQTFDLVSAYYFARNLDLSNIKVGDDFKLQYFLNDEITSLTVEYVGKEVLKTSFGKIRCLKFSPSISPGRIFRKDSRLYLWITDDDNRIPVKAQGDVIVGSVTMELSEVKGLKEPLEIIK